MNNESFVEAIRLLVRDASIDDVLENVADPPGRKPPEKLVKLSEWFNSLDDFGKGMVKSIISESVDMGVFSFLAILDGVRKFDDSPNSFLKLEYVNESSATLINDPNREYLHDIFNREE